MAVKLRDYQRNLLSQAQTSLHPPHAKVMLQLPTGGGKTLLASALLADWMTGGGKAVWLTHRRELSDQTCNVLNDAGVRATNSLTWGTTDPAPARPGTVVILMAQTVAHRNRVEGIWQEYNEHDLLIIDEAHHATADGWQRSIKLWPGRVLGLTATPWRLSRNDGFNHLFNNLILGPQVEELKSAGWVCEAPVLMPPKENMILGGKPAQNGEYNESGIDLANQDRPNVMTGGVLDFWQRHAAERQTIVYAVTVTHAQNLAAIFNKAGIPADTILGSTPLSERAKLIEQFKAGNLKVLVNVAVATEGFDLPDANCVVMARPTMSLALYLQMVGRGRRPKADGGDCLILDLAGNVETHGRPDDERGWSLEPRGQDGDDDAPVVRCPDCDSVSPAASRCCQNCQKPFGKFCGRCGAWRAWRRWAQEEYCGNKHDLVCDLCHIDAHKVAKLPIPAEVTNGLKEAAKADPEISVLVESLQFAGIQFALPLTGDEAIRNLLEEERQLAEEERRTRIGRLQKAISEQEIGLSSEQGKHQLFSDYLESLPAEQRPQLVPAISALYQEWEQRQAGELASQRGELRRREDNPIDKHLILYNARERVVKNFLTEKHTDYLCDLFAEAHIAALWPDDGWVSIDWVWYWKEMCDQKSIDLKPRGFREWSGSHEWSGSEVAAATWRKVLINTAEWLTQEGCLTGEVRRENAGNKLIVGEKPVHPNGVAFTNPEMLPNGLYLETAPLTSNEIVVQCRDLLVRLNKLPSPLQVRLSPPSNN